MNGLIKNSEKLVTNITQEVLSYGIIYNNCTYREEAVI